MVFAKGRDPYIEPWQDVLQLNAFSPALREAAADTVTAIGDQCDGVRCDMAMLMTNEVFARTWGERAGAAPEADFWPTLIARCRQAHPDFLFIAEVYWDMEWTLQQQGFDLCYDKRLYDRLVHDEPASVRGHLQADDAYQQHLIRFIENHDEPRAALTFGPARARTAAVVMSTLQGARLYHDGQLEGFRTHLPIQLGRQARRTIRPRPTRLLQAAAPRHRRGATGVRRLAPMRLHNLLRGSTPPTRRVVLVKPTGAPSGRGQPLTRRRRGPSPTAVARSRRTDLGPRRPAERGPLHIPGRRTGPRRPARHTRRLGIPVPSARDLTRSSNRQSDLPPYARRDHWNFASGQVRSLRSPASLLLARTRPATVRSGRPRRRG